MAEKPNLAVAMKALIEHPPSEPESRTPHSTSSLQPLSRQGKKTIAGHFDPAVSKQLRAIALAEDTSVQELLREALNDLFTKRGKPPIA